MRRLHLLSPMNKENRNSGEPGGWGDTTMKRGEKSIIIRYKDNEAISKSMFDTILLEMAK